MAHIRKKGAGQWQVRYRDPAGTERARTYRRKADAEKFLVTVEADKLRGTWADPRLGKITFSEWLPTWEASRVHLRLSTRAGAESLMKNHVLPYFGTRQFGSVTPTEVQGYVAHLEEKGLAASTIRQAYLLVAGLFSSALDSDLIARTPCRGIKLPPRSQTEMRFLTADEVADVAHAIEDPYRALVLTAAYAGCRFGELAGLRAHRLDLLRRSLTIAETLSDVRGQVRLALPKTTAARRQVPLPKFLSEELARHLAQWPPGVDGSYSHHPRVDRCAAPTSGDVLGSLPCAPRWVSRSASTTSGTPTPPCSLPRGNTQKSSSSGWDTHRFRSPLTPTDTCSRAWMRLPPTVSTQHFCGLPRTFRGLAPFRTCTNSLAETQKPL